MKLLELKKEVDKEISKDGFKRIWVNLASVVSFTEAKDDLVINCSGDIAYRLVNPGESLMKLIKAGVILECKGHIE